MKKFKFILVISVLFCVSCEQNNELKSSSMQYLKTISSGCNNEINDSEENDAVIVSAIDDNIHVFVGINYTCGAPFETRCEVENNTVFMYIVDTCEDIHECYERCICYYTFDFVFKQGELNQDYKIVLIDPRKETPKTIDANNFQNRLQTK